MANFTFDHLHLRSPDPEAAAGFYVGMLGASISNRVNTPNGLRIILQLGGMTTFIEQVPAGTHAAPMAPYIGVEWRRQTGDTARFTRATGDDPDMLSFVAGIRIWF